MARAMRRTPAASPSDAVEPLGTVRRSQLISTFGIGAIVDLEKGSFMPMGLEDWERVTGLPSLSIGEPRLQAMLGVSHFRLGPVKEDLAGTTQVRARSCAPAVRFPEWHECPKCHRLGREGEPFELAADGGRLACLAHGTPVNTTPVRFVVACRRGHISDFPWEWWSHRDRLAGVCDSPRLYLGSHARSASLADLYVRCAACSTDQQPVRKSLGDAFGADALSGSHCSGFRPWLYDREADCGQPVRALQRGASNVHFAVVCSALSIPPASEAVSLIVQEIRAFLDGVPEATLPAVLSGVAAQHGVAVEQLLTAYRQLRTLETGGASLTERLARAEEYAALSEDREDPVIGGVMPQFRNKAFVPPVTLTRWFDLVPDMLNHGGHNLAEEIAEVLTSKGYVCRYSLLNAAFYGVPQMRERMILIAIHREVASDVNLPDPTHWIDLPPGYSGTRAVALKLLRPVGDAGNTHHYLEPPCATSNLPAAVTAEEAIGDLPIIDARRLLEQGTLRRGKRAFDIAVPYHPAKRPTEYARDMRAWPDYEGRIAIYDHVIRYLPRDYQLFAGLKPGDQYPEAHRFAISLFEKRLAERRLRGEVLTKGSKAWKALQASIVPPYDAGKFPNKWRKMEANRPARTLLAHLGKDSYTHIHYDSAQARPISVREAARLQSFPDGFTLSGTMNPAFRQIGNAVPPLFAWRIASTLKAQLAGLRSGTAELMSGSRRSLR